MKSDYAVPLGRDEHVRFLRPLEFLDNEMMYFHEGGYPNYDLMRDVIYYLQHYADRHHHPREDIIEDTFTPREKALTHEVGTRQEQWGLGPPYSCRPVIRNTPPV